jgi:exoribonuclease-2
LRGEEPPFAQKSTELLAAMRDFELTYAAYAEFQRGMERYWCLRWLLQQGMTSATARVLREGLVVLEHLPLFIRLPSLPTSPVPDRGARVSIEIERIDLLEAEIRARYVELLASDSVDDALDDSEEDSTGA